LSAFIAVFAVFAQRNAIGYYCVKYNSLGSEFAPSLHTEPKINSLHEDTFNNFTSTSKNIASNNILEKKLRNSEKINEERLYLNTAFFF
jgi:hypothetical protein